MVFVLSKDKTPLAPTCEAKAGILLREGKAVVHKIYLFTLRLKEKKECKKKFNVRKCFFFAEIVHRGKVIKQAMDLRRIGLSKQHYYDVKKIVMLTLLPIQIRD